jgi:hypothetical protein
MTVQIPVLAPLDRTHTALKGKTPAQAAGIDLQLEGNKWEAIIKKASATREKGQ